MWQCEWAQGNSEGLSFGCMTKRGLKLLTGCTLIVSKKQGYLLPALVAISGTIFPAFDCISLTPPPYLYLWSTSFAAMYHFNPWSPGLIYCCPNCILKRKLTLCFQPLIDAVIIINAHVQWYFMIQTSFITETASNPIKPPAPSLP